jgi:hypothetical protein
MVRAAAAGAIDYSRADPKDINWKIRHRLLLREMERQENNYLFAALHRHHLAYVAHGNLLDESYANASKQANVTLTDIQKIVFPWFTAPEPAQNQENKTDTIKPETKVLIEKYEKMQAAARAAEQG